MPLYLKSMGLSTEQIGFQLAMGAIIAVIGQPFFGYVSDKIQSTKKVLVGVMIAALAVSFLYFSAQSLILMLFLFIMMNFFASSTGPLTENVAMTFALKNDTNYGSLRLWGDVGVGVASVILGVLIGVVGIQHLGKMYAAILTLAIMVGFFLQEGRKKTSTSITLGSVQRLFQNREYIWFLFISLLMFATHRMNDSLFTVYLSDVGGSEFQVGLGWMLATFATVPLFIYMRKLLSQYKELTLMFISAIFYCIRWMLYSFFDHPIALIILQTMHGVTFPIFIVAGMFFVTRIVPEEIIATGQTIFIAIIFGMGGLIGSGGGGMFMSHFGAQATYQLGAIVTAVGALLCALTLYSQQQVRLYKRS